MRVNDARECNARLLSPFRFTQEIIVLGEKNSSELAGAVEQ